MRGGVSRGRKKEAGLQREGERTQPGAAAAVRGARAQGPQPGLPGLSSTPEGPAEPDDLPVGCHEVVQ